MTQEQFNKVIKIAEDHAYFAGKEKLRQDLLKWAEEQKQAICINGNKETAYDRGQYSVIQALIDKLNNF